MTQKRQPRRNKPQNTSGISNGGTSYRGTPSSNVAHEFIPLLRSSLFFGTFLFCSSHTRDTCFQLCPNLLTRQGDSGSSWSQVVNVFHQKLLFPIADFQFVCTCSSRGGVQVDDARTLFRGRRQLARFLARRISRSLTFVYTILTLGCRRGPEG